MAGALSGTATETSGVCASTGWSDFGTGPNCTYVGSRDWIGRELMVGACARNVRVQLERHSQRWITSLLDAAAGGVLIFEDSQRAGDPDGTRGALRAWAARDARVRLLLAAPLLYPKWSRTQRLALCRNMIVQEAARVLPEQGALVAIDLDCHAPAADVITSALATMSTLRQWDVLTANTQPPTYYYDRWALRSRVLGLDYDCWFNSTQKRLRGGCPDIAISVDPAAAPIAVDSAFNGLGLYRAAALRVASDCRYRGTKNSYLCEHVPFHLCMRAHHLRLALMPSLSTSCGAPILSGRQRTVRYLADGTVDEQAAPLRNASASTPRRRHGAKATSKVGRGHRAISDA